MGAALDDGGNRVTMVVVLVVVVSRLVVVVVKVCVPDFRMLLQKIDASKT